MRQYCLIQRIKSEWKSWEVQIQLFSSCKAQSNCNPATRHCRFNKLVRVFKVKVKMTYRANWRRIDRRLDLGIDLVRHRCYRTDSNKNSKTSDQCSQFLNLHRALFAASKLIPLSTGIQNGQHKHSVILPDQEEKEKPGSWGERKRKRAIQNARSPF